MQLRTGADSLAKESAPVKFSRVHRASRTLACIAASLLLVVITSFVFAGWPG